MGDLIFAEDKTAYRLEVQSGALQIFLIPQSWKNWLWTLELLKHAFSLFLKKVTVWRWSKTSGQWRFDLDSTASVRKAQQRFGSSDPGVFVQLLGGIGVESPLTPWLPSKNSIQKVSLRKEFQDKNSKFKHSFYSVIITKTNSIVTKLQYILYTVCIVL